MLFFGVSSIVVVSSKADFHVLAVIIAVLGKLTGLGSEHSSIIPIVTETAIISLAISGTLILSGFARVANQVIFSQLDTTFAALFENFSIVIVFDWIFDASSG